MRVEVDVDIDDVIWKMTTAERKDLCQELIQDGYAPIGCGCTLHTNEQTELRPIDEVQIIEIIDGMAIITYKDGTKFFTKDNIKLATNYKNDNDHPLIDHCI